MIEDHRTHEVLSDKLTSLYRGSIDDCRRCAQGMCRLFQGETSIHYAIVDISTSETIELWYWCCGAARDGDCPNCKAFQEMQW